MTGMRDFSQFVAIDLGASNGRVVLAAMHKGRMALMVAHRFEHAPRMSNGHLRWDWERILRHVRQGLREAVRSADGKPITSLSCSAWAQDFGLLDSQGNLCYEPVSYRDPRTRGIWDVICKSVPPTEVVAHVGVGLTPVTTLAQLVAMARNERPALDKASLLLHISDLIHYDLCGRAATDWTLASASQLLNLSSGRWETALLARLGVPSHLAPPLHQSPGVLACIEADRAPDPALIGLPVVVSANHDTAAACAALGAMSSSTAFFSAGTYAMLGLLSPVPVLPEELLRDGYACIGLADRWWGLFAPVGGLRLLQQCRLAWNNRGVNLSAEALTVAAAESATEAVIDPCDPRFDNSERVLETLNALCCEQGARPPLTPGETARVLMDSMAAQYAAALKRMAAATGREITRVRVVSGGSCVRYLCQRLADMSGLQVIAGPQEATVIGNVILQARALRLLSTDQEQCMISESFPTTTYEPRKQ